MQVHRCVATGFELLLRRPLVKNVAVCIHMQLWRGYLMAMGLIFVMSLLAV